MILLIQSALTRSILLFWGLWKNMQGPFTTIAINLSLFSEIRLIFAGLSLTPASGKRCF